MKEVSGAEIPLRKMTFILGSSVHAQPSLDRPSTTELSNTSTSPFTPGSFSHSSVSLSFGRHWYSRVFERRYPVWYLFSVQLISRRHIPSGWNIPFSEELFHIRRQRRQHPRSGNKNPRACPYSECDGKQASLHWHSLSRPVLTNA